MTGLGTCGGALRVWLVLICVWFRLPPSRPRIQFWFVFCRLPPSQLRIQFRFVFHHLPMPNCTFIVRSSDCRNYYRATNSLFDATVVGHGQSVASLVVLIRASAIDNRRCFCVTSKQPQYHLERKIFGFRFWIFSSRMKVGTTGPPRAGIDFFNSQKSPNTRPKT